MKIDSVAYDNGIACDRAAGMGEWGQTLVAVGFSGVGTPGERREVSA